MKFVIIESPYAGDVETNVTYARRCMRDAIERGEAPFASHLLYTQPGILNDDVADERRMGIECGLEIAARADLTAVYVDYGISNGMEIGTLRAERAGRPIEIRNIGRNP